MSEESSNPQPATPPRPSGVPERFSQSEKGKELIRQALEELKTDVESEQAKKWIESIDAKFTARQAEILHASQEARHELTAELTGKTAEQTVEALKKVIEEEVVEGELKVGDLKTLTRTPLMKLEAERPGALLFAFTTWGDKYAHVKVEDFEPYKNPAPGTEVEIHFRGNDQAYWKIGAGDILPPSVQCVTITDAEGNVRTGARRDSPRNGFYDHNGYIPIFDNYTIEIEPPEKAAEVKAILGTLTRTRDTLTEEDRAAEQAALAKTARTVRSGPTEGKRRYGRTLAENKPITESIDKSWLQAGYEASAYYAERLGVKVDPSVIFAVIKKESGFNPSSKNPKSSARGLGQFLNDTWAEFRWQNDGLIRELFTDTSPQHNGPDQSDPILSIYAVTWFLAKNAKAFGLEEVKAANTGDAYLMYHNGPGGYKTFKRYSALLAAGKSDKEAAKESGFAVPKSYAAKHKTTASYARFLEKFSGDVKQVAIRYGQQLAAAPRATAPRATAPRVTATASSTQPGIEQLDELAKNPTLDGRTLLIGSSSTTGYAPKIKGAITTDAESGRSIVTMFERLKKMPLADLRTFDRIVLQGGVKNTDHNAPTIDTSRRTIDAMVAYLRKNAPNVKIYVVEVTPWNAKYDQKIREFNAHINSPEFRASVAGIIPTYSIMNNGDGRQRDAFGKPGDLHVARYDRYAGVLADWITRNEQPRTA